MEVSNAVLISTIVITVSTLVLLYMNYNAMRCRHQWKEVYKVPKIDPDNPNKRKYAIFYQCTQCTHSKLKYEVHDSI